MYSNAVFDAKVFYLKEGKTMFHHECSLNESVQILLYKPTYGIKSSVIRQKSKSPNGCFKQTNMASLGFIAPCPKILGPPLIPKLQVSL